MPDSFVPAVRQPEGLPTRPANPRRGANHVDMALAFLHDHPVGTSLQPDAFDRWVQHRGFMNVPLGAPKDSDAWMAYLQRRHHLRYNINKAASHPRMQTPFVIETVGPGLWEVRPPQVAISRTKMLAQMESLVGTKRKQLRYLMESADWSILPPHDRAIAETLYDDIDMFQRKVELETECLGQKFTKLEHKLRVALETGALRPQDGGIRALLNPPGEDATEEEAAD